MARSHDVPDAACPAGLGIGPRARSATAEEGQASHGAPDIASHVGGAVKRHIRRMSMSSPGTYGEVVVVYDGDCPFCTRFAELVRLRKRMGPVRIVDAREGGPEVEAVREAGFDLDEGNAVLEGGRIHHGPDAQLWLAAHSARYSMTGLALRALFATPWLARRSYPLLKGVRNLSLRLRGKDRINAAPGSGS